MIRQFFAVLLLFASVGLTAQFANPISWQFSHERVSGNEYKLIATSTAEENFSIYSQFTPEGGPIPTTFTWAAGDHYELIGKTEESGHKKSGVDDLFGVEVIKYLSDQPVTWTQRVRIKDYGTPIRVTVEWMCCDDEQCLPPTDEEYSYVVSKPAAVEPAGGSGEDDGSASVAPPPSPAPAAAPTQNPDPARVAPANPNSSATPAIKESAKNVSPLSERKPTAAPDPAAVAPPNPNSSAFPAAQDAKQEGRPATPAGGGKTYTARGPAATENDPVSWAFNAEDLGNNTYRLSMTGLLTTGWTIYSMDVDPDIGPIPTTFYVEENEAVTPLDDATESSNTLRVKFDKAWDAEVAKINGGTVTYSQTVRVAPGAAAEGYVEYQSCDDEMCFPPKEVSFVLNLEGADPVVSIDGIVGGTTANPTKTAGINSTLLSQEELGVPVAFNPEPVGSCSVGEASTDNKSLWTIFGLGLLGGLFAMLMPCIFPMIPLTVSFFTKSGGTRGEGIRKAGLYGFFIFLIYVLLSIPFHLLDGLDPGILNSIASSVPLNIVFFVVFMFFAGSFFGFYELTLPESWSNRASQAEGTGGVAGIFFMALTLALVSFSCTGPILGSLLVEAVSGGAWPLTAGMAGFGVALGLPFALFAAFPGFLNSMPKSGGWLNSVKVVLGFVEVALAFKFLSNADLVGEWDLLRIEPFLFVWILCSLGIAAYLLGFINFPLDSKNRKAGPLATVIAVAGVIFTGYLAFGLTADGDTGTYRNRALLSGIAPPVCYNYFLPCDEDRNLTPFKSLAEGLAYAREVNKPVMLDFTGYTCVNCRKMEENVWTVDKVDRYLKDDYVIVSLYVDDRTELPAAEHREVTRLDGTGRKKTIDQVGEKWHYLQQSVYAKSSQPYYVLVHPDGTTLNPPVAYTPDADDYANFLECGLATYRSMEQTK